MALISVIIPTYNAEKTIAETVQSVLQQTFTDFELIIIDDGSSDGTLKLLEGIHDERLKIYPFENGGVATARNRGIEKASGEFIALMDHDDLWTQDKLEKQLTRLQATPEADVCYSWLMYIRRDKGELRFFPAAEVWHEGDVYPDLLLRNFIESGSNMLVRRRAIEAVGFYDAAPINCEDWDYNLRLAAKFKFVLVPQHLVIYRQSPSAESQNVKKTEQGGLVAIEKTYQTAPPELQYLKSRTLSNHYRHLAGLYVASSGNSRDVWTSLSRLLMAIRYWPKTLLQSKTYFVALRLLMNLLFPRRFISVLQELKIKLSRQEAADPRTVRPAQN